MAAAAAAPSLSYPNRIFVRSRRPAGRTSGGMGLSTSPFRRCCSFTPHPPIRRVRLRSPVGNRATAERRPCAADARRDLCVVHGRGLLWIIQISSRIITTHEMTTDGIEWLDACPNAFTPMPPSTSDQTMATKTWEYRLSLI
jgi:hypothetical protein